MSKKGKNGKWVALSQICVSGSGVTNDLVTNENDLVGQERDGLVIM